MKIIFNSTTNNVRLGGTLVTAEFSTGQLTLTYQVSQVNTNGLNGDPDAYYTYTFEWVLEGVEDYGTFYDGSPWVTAKDENAGITVVSISPTPVEWDWTNSANSAVLTLKRNGCAVNPRVYFEPNNFEDPWCSLAGSGRYVGGPLDNGNWRLTETAPIWTAGLNNKLWMDNRQTASSTNPVTMEWIDAYEDQASWDAAFAAFGNNGAGGAGQNLVPGDSFVTTLSEFDPTDDRPYNQVNVYVPQTGNNTVGPVARFGVLTVLDKTQNATAISEMKAGTQYFRPAVHWNHLEDRTLRPLHKVGDIVGATSISALSNAMGGYTTGPAGWTGLNAQVGSITALWNLDNISFVNGIYNFISDPTELENYKVGRMLEGPIMRIASGVVYTNSFASKSIHPAYTSKIYGDKIHEVLANTLHLAICNNTSSRQETLIKNIVQYAIDGEGAITCGGPLGSGAGQKPAFEIAFILLKNYLHNAQSTVDNGRSVEDVYTYLMSPLTTAFPNGWVNLSADNKRWYYANTEGVYSTYKRVFDTNANGVASGESSTIINSWNGTTYRNWWDLPAFEAQSVWQGFSYNVFDSVVDSGNTWTNVASLVSQPSADWSLGSSVTAIDNFVVLQLPATNLPLSYPAGDDKNYAIYWNLPGAYLKDRTSGKSWRIVKASQSLENSTGNVVIYVPASDFVGLGGSEDFEIDLDLRGASNGRDVVFVHNNENSSTSSYGTAGYGYQVVRDAGKTYAPIAHLYDATAGYSIEDLGESFMAFWDTFYKSSSYRAWGQRGLMYQTLGNSSFTYQNTAVSWDLQSAATIPS